MVTDDDIVVVGGVEMVGRRTVGGEKEREGGEIVELIEDKSEAFLFNLETLAGREGVPEQGCCLWQEVWKVFLQTKHLIGFAGFFMALEQRWQLFASKETSLEGLPKLLFMTALLKAAMS